MTGFPLLFKLLIAHFAGDFLLQSSRMVENRSRTPFSLALVYHLLIHLACILVLFLFDIDWRIPAIILVSHGAIDMLKTRAERRMHRQSAGNASAVTRAKAQNRGIRLFFIDQILHLSVIVVVWLVATEQTGILRSISVPDQWWLIMLAFLIVTTPTGIVIGKLVRRWYDQVLTGPESVTGTVTGSIGGLPNAGSWIGVIERVLTLSFILAGSFEAIGFLLAAKSILRIGDLKDDREHRKTEYILIGTLLSFGITIIIGLGLLLLLKHVG